MRTIYILFLLLMVTITSAQTITEKFNSLMNRHEYFDSQGNMVGYKSYDSLMGQWNYYDTKQQSQAQPNYQYIQPINLKLVNQALASKQARYDANTQRVQSAINELRNAVRNSTYSEMVKSNAITAFNNQCVNALNSKNYDYSSNNQTNEIINWLYISMNNLVGNYVEKEEIDKQKRKELTSQIANEMVYNSGAYYTTDVTEEKYNPYTKTYEVTSKDTTLTKVYIDGKIGRLYYLRNNSTNWRYYEWKYVHADDRYHTLQDIHNGNQVEIGILFDWIVFYEEKVGEVYTKRYIYRNLKKDNIVVKK